MNNLTTIDLAEGANFSLSEKDRVLTVVAYGNWSLATIASVEKRLNQSVNSLDYDTVYYDLSAVTALDTAGALVLSKAIKCKPDICYPYKLSGHSKGQAVLMRAVAEAARGRPPEQQREWYDILVRMGMATERFVMEAYDTLSFLGRFSWVFVQRLVKPHTIRWKSVVAQIENIGLNAAPVIMTLSFFVGAVIAYMSANILASMGTQAFMVEFIGISVLREFAVVIMAIILAGRSASSFTAQIGAMRMRQEVDAMQIIGLDRYDALILPRVLACVLSAPILTFLAMVAGISGGIFVAWFAVDGISPKFFVTRLQEVVTISNFWVGLVKAPVFALFVAIIGCRQGLVVAGSVDSLGARTTKSVVQAIFAVITADAIFAILLYYMGV